LDGFKRLLMNEIEFWRLQKTANLSNSQAAEWLGVNSRQITRWRTANPEAPKAVVLALKYLIKYGDKL